MQTTLDQPTDIYWPPKEFGTDHNIRRFTIRWFRLNGRVEMMTPEIAKFGYGHYQWAGMYWSKDVADNVEYNQRGIIVIHPTIVKGFTYSDMGAHNVEFTPTDVYQRFQELYPLAKHLPMQYEETFIGAFRPDIGKYIPIKKERI